MRPVRTRHRFGGLRGGRARGAGVAGDRARPPAAPARPGGAAARLGHRRGGVVGGRVHGVAERRAGPAARRCVAGGRARVARRRRGDCRGGCSRCSRPSTSRGQHAPGGTRLDAARVLPALHRHHLQVAAVFLVAGLLALRRLVPVGRSRAGMALGAAGGAMGGLVLAFICPFANTAHVVLAHVGGWCWRRSRARCWPPP